MSIIDNDKFALELKCLHEYFDRRNLTRVERVAISSQYIILEASEFTIEFKK